MLLMMPSKFVGILKLLANFTMLQGFAGVTHVDGVYWTLMYELQFYIYVAVLLFLRQGKNLKYWALTGTLLSAAHLILSSTLGSNLAFKALNFALMREYGISFFGGVFLCALKKNMKDLWAVAGLAACVALSWFLHTRTYFMAYIITVALMLVVIVLHRERFGGYLKAVDFLDRKLLFGLSFIAGISFPLYLLHQNIGMAIIRLLQQGGMTSQAFVLIPIVLSIGLALAVNRLVERSAEKLLRGKKARARSDGAHAEC